ncbi:hypothetical protein [Nonomuraea fuscirosea]|uniref:hypothetical protein n=1 Tax=Nonomuraea fuscirosea TaxID=1291556 RepID=UPI0033C7E619
MIVVDSELLHYVIIAIDDLVSDSDGLVIRRDNTCIMDVPEELGISRAWSRVILAWSICVHRSLNECGDVIVVDPELLHYVIIAIDDLVSDSDGLVIRRDNTCIIDVPEEFFVVRIRS